MVMTTTNPSRPHQHVCPPPPTHSHTTLTAAITTTTGFIHTTTQPTHSLHTAAPPTQFCLRRIPLSLVRPLSCCTHARTHIPYIHSHAHTHRSTHFAFIASISRRCASCSAARAAPASLLACMHFHSDFALNLVWYETLGGTWCASYAAVRAVPVSLLACGQ